MSKKLTPWFPDDVKPVYAGWYERDYGFSYATYDYFDGQNFYFSSQEEFLYGKPKLIPSFRDNGCGIPWRGLAEKPE